MQGSGRGGERKEGKGVDYVKREGLKGRGERENGVQEERGGTHIIYWHELRKGKRGEPVLLLVLLGSSLLPKKAPIVGLSCIA